jgi:MraZ protein
MFRGRFEHTIDTKGRLSIPSRFREILATRFDERLIITNFDNCLWCYPVSEWQVVEAKVASLPQFKDEVKALQRVFISAAVEVPVDKAGRVLVPPTLRDYAGIEKNVILVGMTSRIEIWSKERWELVFQSAQESLLGMGDKLADLGL